jgi:hypothetical protein
MEPRNWFLCVEDLPRWDPIGRICEIRTDLVRLFLQEISYSTCHMPMDFVVEDVEETIDGEIWRLGS